MAYFIAKKARNHLMLMELFLKKGGFMMILGISDSWILGALILSLISMVGCVAYGVANWNKGDE